LRFRSTGMIDNDYLCHYLYWLKSQGFFSHYRDQSSVNSVFNASAAAKIPVAYPDQDERARIVQCLDTIGKKIQTEVVKRNALNVIFNTLLHHLMTGHVRVNHLKFAT